MATRDVGESLEGGLIWDRAAVAERTARTRLLSGWNGPTDRAVVQGRSTDATSIRLAVLLVRQGNRDGAPLARALAVERPRLTPQCPRKP